MRSGFRLPSGVAKGSATPPLEVMPDLIAGALAQRNIDRAIKLLESEKDRGVFGADEIFLLSYLYCLNGSVEKAETLVGENAASIKKDWFVDWLWEKLQTDFGFHPPPSMPPGKDRKNPVCLMRRDASHAVGSQSGRVAVLCGVLFLSGTGALIFETLWLRLSGLAFGNSIWAAALILSSFMAGLALGNALAASSRIRRWRPLHFYAVLELLVAFFGCTIVFGLPVVGDLMRPMWQMLWDYQPTLLGLRFVVSFLILLVPTTAMGLTLPVIIEDPLLRETEFGRAIGFLYGSNTLGAMLGAVLGEAYLIGAFGLYGTSLAAGAAVCVAAAIALSVARFGAARYVADFKSADPAGAFQISVDLRRELSAAVEFAFRQLRDGLHFSRARSNLVSLPAAVRRLVADCFRDHARDGAGRNWSRQSRGWRRFSFPPSIESNASDPVARSSDFGASLIFIFSGRIDPGADRCVRPSLVADRGSVCRADVPRRVAVRHPVSNYCR